MTNQGLGTLLDAIDRHYPLFKNKKSVDDIKMLFVEWSAIFAGYEDGEILKALTEHIKTSKYPPTASELLDLAKRDRLVNGSEPPRIEAPRIVMDMDTLALEVWWYSLLESIKSKPAAYQRTKELRDDVYDFGPIEDKTGGEPWRYLERWPWDDMTEEAIS
jgi:hypothetical protein